MHGLIQDRVTQLDGKRRGSAPVSLSTPSGNGISALAHAMDREVIPRLVVAHRRLTPLADSEIRPGRGELVEFAGLLATGAIGSARERVDALRARGASVEGLCLHLLVPAARRLSDLWEADLCQYEEIAVGLVHLQQLLHDLSPLTHSEPVGACVGHRALLISAPAERTLLGVFMVSEFCRCVTAEFFHRAGWDVLRAPPLTRTGLLQTVRQQDFDLLDISVTCETRLPLLAQDISDLRSASRNPRLVVTVGGPVFFDHPELAASVGADAGSRDPLDALTLAESLYSSATQPDGAYY